MNTRNIVRQAQFAIACIVTSCVFLISGAHADEVRVSGKVVAPNGKPVGGVGIRFWERGNLGQRDATTTSDEGDFSLTLPETVDAILLHDPDFHIGVKAIPKGIGSLNLGDIVMYPMKYGDSDYASSALRFSQIANDYEKLALLAFSTDEITRRFIAYELDKMEVGPRLQSLTPPSEAPEAVKSHLDEMRGRILHMFASLKGNNAGPMKKDR